MREPVQLVGEEVASSSGGDKAVGIASATWDWEVAAQRKGYQEQVLLGNH